MANGISLDNLTVLQIPRGFKPGGFDCGEKDLTDYLCDGSADTDERSGFSRTYLVYHNEDLVGYFSLSSPTTSG